MQPEDLSPTALQNYFQAEDLPFQETLGRKQQELWGVFFGWRIEPNVMHDGNAFSLLLLMFPKFFIVGAPVTSISPIMI